MTRRPDTFIVGAPKSGTSSLHRYLDRHPQVVMSRPKEPMYFSPDVQGTRHEHPFVHPADERRYLELFSTAGAATRVGESSTNYLMSPLAPGLIRDFQPEARIIAMVRNPVDLVHSLHAQRITSGYEDVLDFGKAISLDDARRAGRQLPLGLSGFGVAYRDNALLGEQLERWLDVFGRGRIHVIVYDDFARDTAAAYSAALSFLDVDNGFTLDAFEAYNQGHVRRGRLLRGLYRNKATRWLSDRALPTLTGERGASAARRVVGARRVAQQNVARQPMSPDLRRALEEEFSDDVDKLARLTGRDLKLEWFGRDVATATA